MVITLEKIQADLKSAMKAHDEVRLMVVRMLVSAIRNKQIEVKQRDEASEELIVGVIKSEIKKRRDAAETYRQGQRPELAEKEESEIKVLEDYLPEQMSEDEIRLTVEAVIAEAGDKANFGQIMGQVMGRTKNQADGTVVSRIVKDILG
jgi:uncharacterized protein YqeY